MLWFHILCFHLCFDFTCFGFIYVVVSFMLWFHMLWFHLCLDFSYALVSFMPSFALKYMCAG